MAGKIKTDYGWAHQENIEEAWDVLQKAQSGEPIYKIGNHLTSHINDSQFWSLKDPRKMSISDYASRFGVFQTDYDFVLVGRLRPGAGAITRRAVAGVANPGGDIEIVVDKYSVSLEDIVPY